MQSLVQCSLAAQVTLVVSTGGNKQTFSWLLSLLSSLDSNDCLYSYHNHKLLERSQIGFFLPAYTYTYVHYIPITRFLFLKSLSPFSVLISNSLSACLSAQPF